MANTKRYIEMIIVFVLFIALSAFANTKIRKFIDITADERDWKI